MVSLLYRFIALLFQWICIEPCLIYLRRDREDVVSSDEFNNGCLPITCFCWVIPWIWIIENDIFYFFG